MTDKNFIDSLPMRTYNQQKAEIIPLPFIFTYGTLES